MSRDGSGGYSLPANNFSVALSGNTVTDSDANAVWSDIATALAGSVASDGQSTMSGNLKMGGNKLTGLTSGSARTDSVTLGQAQDGAFRFGGVAGGTADALTLSLSPVITAYVNGMTIFFVSSASPNTGAATLNVNSVATDAILKNGSALVAGDIAASKVYAVTYYNSDWHLWAPLPSLAAYALLAGAAFTGAVSVTTSTTGAVLTLSSTEAGAAAAALNRYRNSATPAASDIIWEDNWQGEDSAGNTETYVKQFVTIGDPTSTSEDADFQTQTVVGGTLATRQRIGQGLTVGATSVTDKGVGTINVENGLYIAGAPVGGTITVSAHKNGSNQGSITAAGDVKITFGTEDWDVGSAFASSTWTPPAGKYRVTCFVTYTSANAVDDEEMAIKLYKNGSTHKEKREARGGTANMSMEISCIVDANGTDTFEIYGRKGSGSDGTVSGSTALTWFQASAL